MSKAGKHSKPKSSGKQSSVSKGKIIEAIVASMHEGEGVKVERNIKLPPIGSQEATREIDVLLSSNVCGYPVRWVIECKNYKKRIGVEFIDAFIGKLQDIGIPPQYGIFVTTSDYARGAIEQAKKAGIRLLTIKDNLRDIGPDVQHAVQSTVFLLPVVNGLEFQNFAYHPMMHAAEAAVLFNKQGEMITTIPDCIWQAWIEERLRAKVGPNDVELEFPGELYQRVGGKLTLVTKIVVKVTVVALVLQLTGTASSYCLDNIVTRTTERQQFKVRFNPPKGAYQLKAIESEAKLEEVLRKPAIATIINRVRLPRINFWNVSYWPLSERVMKLLTERIQAFEAGLIQDPRPLNIAELEGTDLSAIFEPIAPTRVSQESAPVSSGKKKDNSTNEKQNDG